MAHADFVCQERLCDGWMQLDQAKARRHECRTFPGFPLGWRCRIEAHPYARGHETRMPLPTDVRFHAEYFQPTAFRRTPRPTVRRHERALLPTRRAWRRAAAALRQLPHT